MIIAGIAVAGGLTIGAISVAVSVPWAMKEKLAKLEARSRERLALIEKGMDPERLTNEKNGAGYDPLFWGFLLAGLGLGVLLGYLLSLMTNWDSVIPTYALGVLLAGVGMIVYSFYRKHSDDQRAL
jgi:hypothetical protein